MASDVGFSPPSPLHCNARCRLLRAHFARTAVVAGSRRSSLATSLCSGNRAHAPREERPATREGHRGDGDGAMPARLSIAIGADEDARGRNISFVEAVAGGGAQHSH
jgi:hypothetical protein